MKRASSPAPTHKPKRARLSKTAKDSKTPSGSTHFRQVDKEFLRASSDLAWKIYDEDEMPGAEVYYSEKVLNVLSPRTL